MIYAALVRGSAEQSGFEANLQLAPHPARPGFVRVDPKTGKRSRTEFSVREIYSGYLLLECRLLTARRHQIRVHLRHLRLPLVGDEMYGGPALWLSTLKTSYRLKPGHTEKPLISRPALHAEQLSFRHPVTGQPAKIEAPWPKDMLVAVKYLRRYAASGGA